MQTLRIAILFGLLIALAVPAALAEEDATTVVSGSVWIGGHYTDFTDNNRKIGEYIIDEDEFSPELRINYLARGTSSILQFDGHFYDRRNQDGIFKARVGTDFAIDVEHRSLIHQTGQDLLTNLEAREAGGGKFLTHEITDGGEDYNIRRREIISHAGALLSQQGNVRLDINHRTILRNGTDQGLTTSHCFSCHVVSQTQKVDDKSHAIEAELQADVKDDLTLAYEAGYRLYQSDAGPNVRQYDKAQHPVNGGSVEEFSSRLQFDNVGLPYGVQAKTEKVSNKVRMRTSFSPKTKLTASVGYNTSTNQNTDLSSNAWFGNASFATVLSSRSRLVAKVKARQVSADDPFIDARDWRPGRPPDPNNPDFDFVRYSALDRRDVDGEAELFHRLSPKTMVQILGGIHWVNRDDYPIADDGLSSTTLAAQLKLRHRPSRKLSGWLKYRLETTSDPYVVSKGLFEARAREDLSRPTTPPPFFPFRFYYEREGLRYQQVSTEPTQAHEFEVNARFAPSMKTNINMSLKVQLDKNDDLDSLDVEHTAFQPHFGINLMPNPRWAISSGYTLNYSKSRGPITIALFDG